MTAAGNVGDPPDEEAELQPHFIGDRGSKVSGKVPCMCPLCGLLFQSEGYEVSIQALHERLLPVLYRNPILAPRSSLIITRRLM